MLGRGDNRSCCQRTENHLNLSVYDTTRMAGAFQDVHRLPDDPRLSRGTAFSSCDTIARIAGEPFNDFDSKLSVSADAYYE